MTSTATSVLAYVTTVLATVVAVLLLGWRLAARRARAACSPRRRACFSPLFEYFDQRVDIEGTARSNKLITTLPEGE